MLTKETRNALQKLVSINDSMVLSFPTTRVVSQNIIAELDISVYETESFPEFGVYSFSEFNSAASLIEGVITVGDTIGINSESTSISYLTTNLDIIKNNYPVFETLDEIKVKPLLGSFTLTADNMDRIFKAAATFSNLSSLAVYQTDMLYLTLCNGLPKKNDFSIKVQSNLTDGFKMIINVETLIRLPKNDYQVNIYQNGNKFQLIFEPSNGIKGLNIILEI